MENQEEMLQYLIDKSRRTEATLRVLTGIIAQLYSNEKQQEGGIKKSHEVYNLEIQGMIDRVEQGLPVFQHKDELPPGHP